MPDELATAPPEPYGSRLLALKADERRGAAQLALEGAQLAMDYLYEAHVKSAVTGSRGALDPTAGLRLLVAGLARVKPSMAPLINLANGIGLAYEKGLEQGSVSNGLWRATSFLHRWLEAAPTSLEGLLTAALKATPGDGGQIFCFSYSSTVAALLERAGAEGRVWQVTLSEARPGLEGLELARQAERAGHAVTLTCDSELPGCVARAGPEAYLLVGADAMSSETFTNKVGTYPLLLAAKQAGAKTMLLATSDKLMGSSLAHLHDNGVAAGALPPEWEALPEGIRRRAPLFEKVPLTLVQTIICEQGKLAKNRLKSMISQTKATSWLAQV